MSEALVIILACLLATPVLLSLFALYCLVRFSSNRVGLDSEADASDASHVDHEVGVGRRVGKG